MAASRRTVVDLPLVPVTRITGTSWISLQSSSSGAGNWPRHECEPVPRPTETRRSPSMQATPWLAAAAARAMSCGSRSASISALIVAAAVARSGAVPATASQAHSTMSVAA